MAKKTIYVEVIGSSSEEPVILKGPVKYEGDYDVSDDPRKLVDYQTLQAAVVSAEIPLASDTVPGIAKLYGDLGANTDGSVNQAVVTDAINGLSEDIEDLQTDVSGLMPKAAGSGNPFEDDVYFDGNDAKELGEISGENGDITTSQNFNGTTSEFAIVNGATGAEYRKFMDPTFGDSISIDDGAGGYMFYGIGLTEGFFIGASDAGSPFVIKIKTNNLTATYTLEYPDKTGVQIPAMISDVAAAVVGIYNDRGNFTPSGNYPSTGGSGTAGAILKGNVWTIAGLGSGVTATMGAITVQDGDTVRALIDTPGNTDSNWAAVERNIGYTPENVANKKTDLLSVSALDYPNVPAVVAGIASAVDPLNSISNPHFFDDFHNLTAWGVTAVNGGINGSRQSTLKEKGIMGLNTQGATNGGYAISRTVNSGITAGTGFVLGYYALSIVWGLRPEILSTVTDEFSVIAGLNDLATGLGTDTVAFVYDRLNHGNFWVCVTRSNSVETRTVTAIPVTLNQVKLRIDINSAGTSVVFSIGNYGGAFTTAATHTTNIPTTQTRDTVSMVGIYKSAGTTTRILAVDFYLEKVTGLSR